MSLASDAAEEAGLVYVADADLAIERKRRGGGFSYVNGDGRALRDKHALYRIKHLGIPPAWTDVRICGDGRGHLQATGRDARGRKQHLYHPDFRAQRDAAKFDRMPAFAAALPKLRRRIERHRNLKGIPREKALATVVHLLDASLIRIGNDAYAAQNKSYGLTTLQDRHAQFHGDEVQFLFQGKSGKQWRVKLKDRRVAKAVKAMQDLPGQRLFQYRGDDGAIAQVTSTDVNRYLREIGGDDITAKDFRTWAGAVLAADALAAYEPVKSDAAAKRNVRDAITSVAERLGNTPAICRKCYVHPLLLDLYLDKHVLKLPPAQRVHGLSAREAQVLALLRRRKVTR